MAVIDAPDGLFWAEIALQPNDSIAAPGSPFDGAQDEIDFGGQWWSAQATTARLDHQQAAAFSAFARRARLAGNRARIAFPWPAGTRGTTAATTLTTTATLPALGAALAVSGLGAGATLLAGTMLSIDDALFELREDATANGAGAATLALWPRARVAYAAGRSVRLGRLARSLWRIDSPPATVWSSALYTRFALSLRAA